MPDAHFDLLQGLDSDERAFLDSHFQRLHFRTGESLIHEGEDNGDLFFIVSGRVALRKGSDVETVTLGEQGTGAVLGELSFLDGSPRSVSVVALEDVVVDLLPKRAFHEADVAGQRLLHHIERNIALLSTQRLRNTSDDFVQSLRREVGLLREQVSFGTLFIIMVLLFGLNGILLKIIQEQFAEYYFYDGEFYAFIYERLISWTGFVIFALPAIYLVRAIDFPIRIVVDPRINWQQTLGESSGISLLLVVLIAIPTLGIIAVPGVPVVNERFNSGWFWNAFTPEYFFHCYIQELVSRGIMQNAIRRFLRDARGHKTIIVCSFAFAIMHVHLGVDVALATGMGGIVFGYIYLRHGNLLGVSLIHWAIGAMIMRYLPILLFLQGS